jgi:hypothetical protein
VPKKQDADLHEPQIEAEEIEAKSLGPFATRDIPAFQGRGRTIVIVRALALRLHGSFAASANSRGMAQAHVSQTH